MRPYLAILKDSFREAMVSRVLWILLVLITLFLIGLAGFGLQEVGSSQFVLTDVVDAYSLVTRLKQQAAAEEPSPGKRIWRLMDSEAKRRLQNKQIVENPLALASVLTDELNRIVAMPEFYQQQAWKGIELDAEARDLLAQGPNSLESPQLARLNRLLINAAYPVELAPPTGKSVYVSYFGGTFPIGLPSSRERVVNSCLKEFTDRFLGVIGVLIAILVTATMIPRTFEAGAIDLLLSKPVSRSFVFLTKFAGGCAFILINAAYFIGGMWLVVGLRIGIWQHRLLLCIPLILFLFVIYYAVSALASVLWQNAIVSIFVTVTFWAACFGVWLVKVSVEGIGMETRRIRRILPAEEGPLVAAGLPRLEQLQEWDERKRVWKSASLNRAGGIKLPPGTRIPVQGGTASVFIDPPTGDAADDAPQGLLLVTSQGLVRFRLDAAPGRRELLGVATPASDPELKIDEPGPPLALSMPFAAAMAPSGKLALYDANKLYMLDRNAEGKYTISNTRRFKSKDRAVMAYGGKRFLIALASGELRLYDEDKLDQPTTFHPDEDSKPQFAYASSDGRWFAVVFHSRRLWLYDVEKGEELSDRIGGQGSISAVAIAPDNQLFVADSFTRVRKYALGDMRVSRSFDPELSTWEWIYWYPVRGIYNIFPKPGELGQMMQYLLTGEQEESVLPTDDLEASTERLNVWQPFWSNLAFVTVMLALGCWYVARKDF